MYNNDTIRVNKVIRYIPQDIAGMPEEERAYIVPCRLFLKEIIQYEANTYDGALIKNETRIYVNGYSFPIALSFAEFDSIFMSWKSGLSRLCN